MDEDRRELARRLCVLATEIAEEALDAAIGCQAPEIDVEDLQTAAARLKRREDALKAVADVINIIASMKDAQG